MHETSLNLSPPAYIALRSPDAEAPVRIDVYEARRALDDACRKPTDALRWAAVLDYLAEKLSVPRESLAENMALEFNDCIVAVIERLNEERKKKQQSIASSLTCTPESPPTSAPGP